MRKSKKRVTWQPAWNVTRRRIVRYWLAGVVECNYDELHSGATDYDLADAYYRGVRWGSEYIPGFIRRRMRTQ